MILKNHYELMRFSVKNLTTLLRLASIEVNVEYAVLKKYLDDFEAGNNKNITVFETDLKKLLGQLKTLQEFAGKFWFNTFNTLEDYLLISAEHYIFNLLGQANEGSKNKLYELFRYVNIECIERIRQEKRALKQQKPSFNFWTIIMSSSRKGNITALTELNEQKMLLEGLLLEIFRLKEVRGLISPSEFHSLADKIRQFLVFIFYEFEELNAINLDEDIYAENSDYGENSAVGKLYGYLHTNFKYRRVLTEEQEELIKRELNKEETTKTNLQNIDFSTLFKEILAKNIDENIYYENTEDLKRIIGEIKQVQQGVSADNIKVQDLAKRSGKAISLLVSMTKKYEESEMNSLSEAIFKCINQSKQFNVDEILCERIKYIVWSLDKVPNVSPLLKDKCDALLRHN